MNPIYSSLGMKPVTSQNIINYIPTSTTSDDDETETVSKNSSKMSLLIKNPSTKESFNMLKNNDQSTTDATNSLSDSNGQSEMEVSERTDVLEPSTTELVKCWPISNLNNAGSPKAKRKKSKDSNRNTTIHNSVNRLANQLRNGEETRSYYYSKYVGKCLDMLDPDLKLEAREKIHEILLNTEREQLQRS